MPKIIELQFMFTSVTGVAKGQKAKNQIGIKNRSAAMLIHSPKRPKDQRLGGNGAPYNRLHTRQLIVMKYDDRMAMPPSELIAFRAAVEPMLMQASSELTMSDTKTA